MNKHIYTVGISALALAMAAMPALALAENGGGEGGVQAQVTAGTRPAITGSGEAEVSGSSGENSSSTEDSQQAGEQVREQAKQQAEQMREGLKQEAEITREMLKDQVEFLREGTTTAALSFEELKQSIEQRKQELDDEEASSSPDAQDIMKNANPVRLAVHSLLASRDLLGGGIGLQVSDIAQQMNDSVATTTSAEAKIQSRGFLTRLLFGGDSASAEAISEAVAKNQESIQKLTDLLNQAGTTAEVKATLEAQITALQDAQTRLQALAQSEQKAWGLFSWRF